MRRREDALLAAEQLWDFLGVPVARKVAEGRTGVTIAFMMRRVIFLLVLGTLAFAQKRPFDVSAMLDLKGIGDPQISPDGKWVTFTVTTVDVPGNKKPQQV